MVVGHHHIDPRAGDRRVAIAIFVNLGLTAAQISEDENSLEAHIAVAEGEWGRADAIKQEIRGVLEDRFSIEHSILELECARHACADAKVFGHSGTRPAGHHAHGGHGHNNR